MPTHSERMAMKAILTPKPMTRAEAQAIAQKQSSHLFQGLTGSQHAQLWNKAHKTAYGMPMEVVVTQVAYMAGLPMDKPYTADNEAKMRAAYHHMYYLECVSNVGKDGFQYTLESF